MEIKSFKFKIFLTSFAILLISGAVVFYLFYRFTVFYSISHLKENYKKISQSITFMINPYGISDKKEISRKLREVKEMLPSISDIFIVKKENGALKYYLHIGENRNLFTSDIDFPLSFLIPISEVKKVSGKGLVLSSYTPIKDRNGETVGILGIETKGGFLKEFVGDIRKNIFLIFLVWLSISFTGSAIASEIFYSPVKRFYLKIKSIYEGGKEKKVNIESKDEFGEIAYFFNKIISHLLSTKKLLQDYFYKTLHTLVRVMEEKDPYTKGHSERVAKYCERIALRLKMPEEKVRLLKEIAMLHDIGKIGIPEGILNKKGTLDEKEWEIVKKHPVIGEKILREVFLNKELLEAIRHHHEHYDGKGYPDGLKKEEINLMAQIISVADAYDAMTSQRPYRGPFTKQQAIEELLKKKGTQFNPKIVDIFIKVLKEEYKV